MFIACPQHDARALSADGGIRPRVPPHFGPAPDGPSRPIWGRPSEIPASSVPADKERRGVATLRLAHSHRDCIPLDLARDLQGVRGELPIGQWPAGGDRDRDRTASGEPDGPWDLARPRCRQRDARAIVTRARVHGGGGVRAKPGPRTSRRGGVRGLRRSVADPLPRVRVARFTVPPTGKFWYGRHPQPAPRPSGARDRCRHFARCGPIGCPAERCPDSRVRRGQPRSSRPLGPGPR